MKQTSSEITYQIRPLLAITNIFTHLLYIAPFFVANKTYLLLGRFFSLRNDQVVCITHHGDQHVHQHNRHDEHEYYRYHFY